MQVRFTRRSIPFAIFILLLFTFGLLVPWLGFYQTDWPIFAAARFPGAIRTESFLHGGAFLNWLQILPVKILDHRAVIWQVYAFLARFFAILSLWWALKTLWPQHLPQVTWMAFIFAVIPIFAQQSLAVTYSAYWLAFGAYFISYGLMIVSARAEKKAWLYTAGALTATLFSLALFPYLVGLEAVRLLILWLLSPSERPRRWRVSFVFLKWLPYAFLYGFLYLTRFLLGFNRQDGLLSFNSSLSSSIASVPQFLQIVLRELINTLFSAWYSTIEPTKIILNDRFWVLAFLVGIFVAGLTMVYLLKLDNAQTTAASDNNKQPFIGQATALGAVALIVGSLPYWASGITSTASTYQNGYPLVAMFGASVLTVALIDYVIASASRKILLISILVGIAVAFHIRTANDFRWMWTDQNRFYWQMYWRAPAVQSGTAFVSDSSFFTRAGGENPVKSALSLLYPDAETTEDLPINLELIQPDQTTLSLDSAASPGEYLAFTYEPENGNCLWILSPDDVERPQVSKILRQSLPETDLSRISVGQTEVPLPPTNLFGSEPEHTWCYFYEQAELARQMKDFKRVAELGDQLKKAGFEPNNMQEWVTFIDGYGRVNRWSDAIKLSNLVYQKQPSFTEWLCSSWKSILSDQEPDAENLSSIEKMLNQLQCTNIP